MELETATEISAQTAKYTGIAGQPSEIRLTPRYCSCSLLIGDDDVGWWLSLLPRTDGYLHFGVTASEFRSVRIDHDIAEASVDQC